MTELPLQDVLDGLLARAVETRTPCGDGIMVWRTWNADAPGRRTVVLLHGGSGAWNHWVRNISALEARFRVIAADLPGCGDSDDPPSPYDAPMLAGILSDGLDRVVPDDAPFDLVSFSFGGVLSGLVAHAQARRIRGVTIVGAPILGLTGTGPANDLVEVPADLPAEEKTPLYRRNLQNRMVHKPDAVDEMALHLHAQNMDKARLRSRRIARTQVLAESLKDLPSRLDCVFGACDVTLAPDLDGVRAYVEEIHPGAEFRVVPEAGHWVQFEAADAVNTILLDLLAKP